jgi:basic membrane protein A
MISRRAALLGLAALPLLGAADRPLCALVHTLAPGDGSVIDAMIAAMKRIGRDRNVTVRTVYAADPGTVPAILELLGEARAAVIVGAFLDMAVPFRAAAPRYPATRFVQLYADANVPPVATIRTVSYDVYHAGYLAGVFGALVSENRVLAYVNGADLPSLRADANAFLAGARSVRHDAEMKLGFVGSFQDPAKAYDVASQLFGNGIEYLQTESSASNLGIIRAAARHRGTMVSAGSTAELAQDAVVAIELCDFGASLYEQTSAALQPRWSGGHHHTGLEGGVVDFVVSDAFTRTCDPALGDKIRRARPVVARVKREIIGGRLTVPFRTDNV